MSNIDVELTAAFNAKQPVVALASGQAVVYYRIAIMSKDGDRVIRETPRPVPLSYRSWTGEARTTVPALRSTCAGLRAAGRAISNFRTIGGDGFGATS